MSQVSIAMSTAPPAESVSARIWRAAYAGVLILAGGVYAVALRGMPIWEDQRLINSGTNSLVECFTKPFLGSYFRPLVSVSFVLDHRLWGGEPFMYHQTNLLLHVATTAVLMAALAAAFRNRWVSFVGGLLFAIQPAQVSAVAWIGGRTDSLCTLWVAAFALALIRAAQATGSRQAAWLACATAAFGLALLTKEQVLALILLVPLAFRCFPPPDPLPIRAGDIPRRSIWLPVVPFVVAAIAFVGAWIAVGPTFLHGARHDLVYTLSLCGRTITYYTLLLLAPTPGSMHSVTVMSLERLGLLSALSGYAALIGSALLWRRWLKTAPQAAWFLGLVVLSLLPVSNLVPVSSLIVAPFRAGVAGIGVAALLGWKIAGMATRPADGAQNRRWAVGGAYAIWCLALVIWGAARWEDEEKVFSTFARYDPVSTYIREGIVGMLLNKERAGAAQKEGETFLGLLFGSAAWRTPESALRAFQNDPQVVARIHQSNGDKRPPRQALSDQFVMLGYARIDNKDPKGALTAFKTGEGLNPNDGSVNLALGRWAFLERSWSPAIRHLRIAVARAPRVPAARYLLGKSYESIGDTQHAYDQFRAMIRIQPWDGGAYLVLAEAQSKAGDAGGARTTMEEAAHHAKTHIAEITKSLHDLAAGGRQGSQGPK